jgi:hypothetical protein
LQAQSPEFKTQCPPPPKKFFFSWVSHITRGLCQGDWLYVSTTGNPSWEPRGNLKTNRERYFPYID